MHRKQKEVCRELPLELDFDKILTNEQSQIGNNNKKELTFDGNLIMDEVLKPLDKKGFAFSCTCLQKKDSEKNTGTINICISKEPFSPHSTTRRLSMEHQYKVANCTVEG